MAKNKKPKRLTEKFWYGYFGAFHILKGSVLPKINEFQKIKDIKENSYDIDLKLALQVYMESIVSDMAKILGLTYSDQTGLREIKKHLHSKKLVHFIPQIEKIETKYKSTISKIKENRNRIIFHLDFHKNPYYKMKRSKDETKRMFEMPDNLIPLMFKDKMDYDNFNKKMQGQLVSNQKRNQRYAPIDLNKDLPLFKEIIEKLEKIFLQILILVNKPK